MATGEYFIVCKVSDYIDNFTETSYPLHVTEQTSLFLDAEIQLPKAFISGQKFFLPIVEAYDYRTNTPKAVKPTITAKISGTQIAVSEDGAIIPTATSDNETLTIKYNYSYGALSNEYSYEVPVIIAKDSDGLAIEKYFYSENFSVDPLLDSIRFSASESGAITTFVKPLQAKSFSLNFSVDQSITNVSYIDFELTDKVYKNISVFVRLYSNGKMSVNGGTRKSVYFTEKDSVKTFGLNYDNDNKAFSDLGGTVFGMVTNLNSGGGFNGFVSDEIYVTVRLGTVKNSVNLFISKLNGQIISRATRDTVPPQIFVNPVLGGSHNIGDTIIVYAAKAYDVLGFVKEFTMTVVNVETGEVLKSVDGITLQDVDASKDYRVTFTSFGQYQITFKAKDSNNRPSEASKNVLIADSEAPIIEIGKAVVSTGKVNESIQLPAMTVKDNYSSSDKIRKYIVVIYPNGFGKICKEYFTPTMQGRYYVRYMAIDENGQIAMKEYKVDVA